MPGTTARTCGSCTACCKSLAVIELKKPPKKWCPHCDIGKGCRIYENKPVSCGGYRCEWLKGFGDEESRPDHLKVILDYFKLPNGLPGGTFQMWEVTEGALGRPFITGLTKRTLLAGIWVSHLPIRGRKKMFVPKERFLDNDVYETMREEGFEVIMFKP